MKVEQTNKKIHKVKRQGTNWGKLFATHITKDYLEIDGEGRGGGGRKMGKDENGWFTVPYRWLLNICKGGQLHSKQGKCRLKRC